MAVKLFEIDENRELVLNKPWILLVPEFAALLARDKGSKGDYRGDKKLKARKELAFIYFMEDFSSPIRDWEAEEKLKEAKYYADLQDKDIDEAVETARVKYADMMLKSSRSLRTLKSVYTGMDALDEYFENIDFKKTDKMGKLLNDPTSFAANITKLNKVYDEIRNFEKRVEEEMKQAASGIRGPNSVLGDKEGQKKTWSEADISAGSANTGGPKTVSSFNDILKRIQEEAKTDHRKKAAEIASLDDEEEDL